MIKKQRGWTRPRTRRISLDTLPGIHFLCFHHPQLYLLPFGRLVCLHQCPEIHLSVIRWNHLSGIISSSWWQHMSRGWYLSPNRIKHSCRIMSHSHVLINLTFTSLKTIYLCYVFGVCLCMCIWAPEETKKEKKSVTFPGAIVTDRCEPPHMGENWTLVLCKNSECS